MRARQSCTDISLFLVSISILLVRFQYYSIIMLCICLLISCGIKVFVRTIFLISFKFSVF